MIKKLDSIKTIVDDLTTRDKIDNLLQHWIEYEKMMLLYLLDEEMVIPLYHAYFDQKSAGEVAQKILKNVTPAEFGSLLYFDNDDVFRNDVMKFLNIPGITWKVEFEKNLKLFAVEFIGNVKALKDGKEQTLFDSLGKQLQKVVYSVACVPPEKIDDYVALKYPLV